MTNLPTKLGLLLAAWLPLQAATAADFAVKDLSGAQDCWPTGFWESIQATLPGVTQCYRHPVGMIEVNITPESGELPIQCYEFEGRSSCMYVADIYVAAHYQGQWLAKTGYTWAPVDIAQLLPTKQWGPWGGTGSLGHNIYVAEIDLNTSQYVPPPEGFEVYVGIAPPGGPNFTPSTVAKIYPVVKP